MLENCIDADVRLDKLPKFVAAFMAHRAPVVCKCRHERDASPLSAALTGSGNWRAWQCADGTCDFYVKAESLEPLTVTDAAQSTLRVPTAPVAVVAEIVLDAAPVAVEEPNADLLTDDELLTALSEQTGFGTGKVARELALNFARFLLQVAPIGAWTTLIAKQQWTYFQQQRRAA